MKTFTTHLYATALGSAEVLKFEGPYILACSWDEAVYYCQTNGLGYLVVDGELVEELKEGNMVKVMSSCMN